jgi:dipeptidase
MLKYSDTSMFWITNRVAQFAYLRYNSVGKTVREYVDKWENKMLELVPAMDAKIGSAKNAKKAQQIATELTLKNAYTLFYIWEDLDKYLMIKYIDGNVKGEENGKFIDNGNGKDIPGKIDQPGYSENWKRAVARDKGEILKVVK